MNPQPTPYSTGPSTPMNLKLTENVYKAHTLRPKTDNFKDEYGMFSMRHKKAQSHDTEGYKLRVRNAIIEIFKNQNHGIFIEHLKQKLTSLLGFQVQNELLGVSNFNEFILNNLGDKFSLQLMSNPLPSTKTVGCVVVPKNNFPTPQFHQMPHWNMPPMFISGYAQSPMPGIGTPSTCDKSRMTPTNLNNLLEKNHSLNQYSRKEYFVSPGSTSFNKIANYKQGDKKSMGSICHLSRISKHEHYDNFSITSSVMQHDLTLEKDLPLNDYENVDKEKYSLEPKKEEECEEKGFTYCVLDLDSIQIDDFMSEKDSEKEKQYFSCKSSEDDNQLELFDEERSISPAEKNLKIRKKQIRLSKSSHKNQNRKYYLKDHKLIKYLEI